MYRSHTRFTIPLNALDEAVSWWRYVIFENNLPIFARSRFCRKLQQKTIFHKYDSKMFNVLVIGGLQSHFIDLKPGFFVQSFKIFNIAKCKIYLANLRQSTHAVDSDYSLLDL